MHQALTVKSHLQRIRETRMGFYGSR